MNKERSTIFVNFSKIFWTVAFSLPIESVFPEVLEALDFLSFYRRNILFVVSFQTYILLNNLKFNFQEFRFFRQKRFELTNKARQFKWFLKNSQK